MKQIVVTRALCCLLLSSSGAWCQNQSPPAEVPQGLSFEGSHPQAAQNPKRPAQNGLPDCPSVTIPPTQADKFQAFVDEARSPLIFGAASINAIVMRDTEEHMSSHTPSFASFYSAAMVQQQSNAFFGKYLYPSLLKQDPRYHPSTSESVLGRMAYAVSRLVITRDDSGKKTLNTSYLLGVLTSAAVTSAYHSYSASHSYAAPYWSSRQSPAATFANFGSTIGSDAGMNVFHEFWPDIRERLDGHSPKFVQKIEKIEKRIAKDPSPGEAAQPPAR